MKMFITLITLSMLSWPTLALDIYQQALANSQRPEQDLEADPRRKPEQVLAFFQLKPGQKVLDLFSGGGYYTELASIVVGEQGLVDAHNNNAYLKFIGEEKLLKRYQHQRLNNVTQLHQEANDLTLCEDCYDRVLMILSFHDLYYVDEKSGWPQIHASSLMAKIRRSLKSGGLVGIVDHNAITGASIEVAQSLHRIDPKLIKDYMTQWGFSFKAESTVLANPQDKGDLPMWDPSVKGHTNRAVMLFKK
ncbi:class I SAM-dependent methyltransferase [Paraglaciecola hydrolytica]|uniref:Methyltransferase type 11 n=1 Tax=Paraglaciecola hydrolytica TaxID=1799789 RepID=A0A136A231_9ALTE|nr:class I SAM-dependent methyltransferase [Paraglaciecola hydrolytica]KXI29299.1 hypothetical protein AX660_14250 [Paraglaciecola hydrolytica]